MKRIMLANDNWVFGPEFFIQAALFEVTGYADWEIDITVGDRHNRTDGEAHYRVVAKRCVRIEMPDNIRTYKTKSFEVNGNMYSYQSIFKSALNKLLKEGA